MPQMTRRAAQVQKLRPLLGERRPDTIPRVLGASATNARLENYATLCSLDG